MNTFKLIAIVFLLYGCKNDESHYASQRPTSSTMNQDLIVIDQSLKWQEAVTDEEPIYEYLDTYAYLMYKSGNKTETKRIAELAIEAAKKENRNSQNMEKLISKL